jgi:hypothetical protein
MPEDKAKPEREPDDATELAADASKAQPAVYADAFLISILDDGLFRLTLAEGDVEVPGRIRAAIVMPTDDVRELVRILTSLLAKLDAKETGGKIQSTGK